ncbi:MAG: hypothetical protein M3033_19250 [Acidobacteriota bacterium]|nr:hypothetical protein [Acidobacteriota bacterium]
MKEDYLWDKTGKDPEIERLEIALQAFRYQETAPPALPAKVIPFKAKPARKIFPFAIAAAACVAFVIIFLSVLFQIFSNRIEVKKELSATVEQRNTAEFPIAETISNSPDLKVKTAEKAKQFHERRIVKINKITSVNYPQKELKTPNIKVQKTNVALTKEEQYAYNQLMLALSITSSKLQLVKDKVEGTN